jgi:UDP-glucose 4-epimerase
MKILVTGGAGHDSSIVIPARRDCGHTVTVPDVYAEGGTRLMQLGREDKRG